jgi:isocitrate dehydrogenase (NAD+)
MLLEHIGYGDQGQRLTRALDICGQEERKVVTTGRSTGATAQEYGDYILETMQSSKVD